ncbi:MAG TPA: hypothetical protein VGU61_19990 [Noviherbaspirillum sp.]|jgi:hypothetical protein|uniref:hypothetical protein n=1 Tax=Noviherbaspirillum sp. TaxID=1926288 RepID=UPI002DDC955B|nr:hypothetical protein [Noviherbaspirillum sp.]HEV2612554.1 hypothetical protein [Noviherbaspirillum sp.]
MPFKPPLTREQLTEIQERNRENEDVITLLWEIKRLRALVLRADQVQRSITPGSGAEMVIGVLRKELEGEPCIAEQSRLDL